jgi:hypothetical protein
MPDPAVTVSVGMVVGVAIPHVDDSGLALPDTCTDTGEAPVAGVVLPL